MSGPLDGLRVVEIGDLAEFAAKLMADMGADVIKVEPPHGAASRHTGPFVKDAPGPERSLHFAHYNTSKRSVTLDVSQRAGRAIWLQLIGQADAVLDSMHPGHLDELGIGPTAVQATQPQLVWTSVTPWGPDGPYAGYLSTDLIQMAMGGIVASCGYDDHDRPPVRPGLNHSLHIAAWQAVISTLIAIHARDDAGGQHIDVAIHDCVSVCTEFAATYWFGSRQLVQRQTSRHAMPAMTPRTIHPARGDSWVLLGALNETALEYFASWAEEAGVDLTAFRDPDGNLVRGPELREAIERITSIMEPEEVWLAGQSLGMTWAAVRRPEDWIDDPHAAERGFFHSLEQPGFDGEVKHPGPPYAFTHNPGRLRRAPLLGEHNTQVYTGLGYSAGEIVALREQAAI